MEKKKYLQAAAFTGALILFTSTSARGSEQPAAPASFDRTPTPPASLFDPNRVSPFSSAPRLEIAADSASYQTATTTAEPMRIVFPATAIPDATQVRLYVEPTETSKEEENRRNGNKGNSSRRTGGGNSNDSHRNSDNDNGDGNDNDPKDPKRCIAIPGGCDPRTPKPRIEPTPYRCIQNCSTPPSRPR
jgi:hypothetical protein